MRLPAGSPAVPRRRLLRSAACQLLGVVVCLQLCPAVAARQQEAQDYVVVFKRGFDASRVAALCAEQADGEERSGVAAAFGGLCRKRFSKLLNGFAGSLTPADVDALLAAFPGAIDHIERDARFAITGQAQPDWLADEVPAAAQQRRRRSLLAAAERRGAAAARRRLPEQADPTWNIDRVDQAALPLDHLYHYDHTGSGVNVYLLDTGIRFTHQEFRSQAGDGPVRARPGFSVFGDGDSSDCNGHGTHTAATVGGLTYGVAKNVTLWAVRAMDCAGGAKVSAILDAFEWIAENAVQPAVVSMSVAGDLSPAVNEAARRLVEDGLVPLVVAAGNSQENACLMSPASSPWAVSVAAADDLDQRWAKSNWGPCVDVHGPGVAVLSAGYQSDGASAYKTGTSMATPHVTGVLALYLEAHPGASPQELRQKVNSAATAGAVRDDPDGFGSWDSGAHPAAVDLSTTPNRLLYSLLPSQATLTPGVLEVAEAAAAPLTVALALSAAPTADVTITVTVPAAAWAGTPLAAVTPASLTIPAGEWASPQTLLVEPSGLVDGTYHLQLQFESADPRFDGLQAVRVDDRRPLTGDDVEAPRVVAALPFSDSDTTSRFSSKYQLGGAPPAPGGGGGAPDVVYAFTPPADVAVDISTCGSLFDTQLYVVEDPQNMQAYVGNDDDPSCTSNPKASRVSMALQAGTTYYVIVDGYAGDWLSSQGLYTLTITAAAATA